MTNIIRFDGQNTYNLWASMMTAIFRNLKLHEIVIQGLLPPPDSSVDEIKAYHCLNDSVLAIIIRARNTAYALVHKLGSLCQLA
ncbi:hypothetical protein GcM1_227009 [Golovinomyces cichoracearum]|uniref:Retrotransposon Copia-like N-terminal domain-containing protein n=1 Tax=Golovinomyces cichoracearum TaxID=62708 RepID=A0A420IP98_9PEZI|nr:hypothetical protein GcM1_227009 [Golovinomyces cichoracearum]